MCIVEPGGDNRKIKKVQVCVSDKQNKMKHCMCQMGAAVVKEARELETETWREI